MVSVVSASIPARCRSSIAPSITASSAVSFRGVLRGRSSFTSAFCCEVATRLAVLRVLQQLVAVQSLLRRSACRPCVYSYVRLFSIVCAIALPLSLHRCYCLHSLHYASYYHCCISLTSPIDAVFVLQGYR